MKNKFPVIKVTWFDAEEIGEVGWNSLIDQKKAAKKRPPLMESVGFLIHDCSTHLSLLSTIGPNESSTLEKIPKGVIMEITNLVPEFDDSEGEEKD